MTTEIKPSTTAANWLQVDERGGYVSVRRVNADGEILQSLTILPEEVLSLAALLVKKAREAA